MKPRVSGLLESGIDPPISQISADSDMYWAEKDKESAEICG
jgi:hypothetical protein